MVRLVAEKFEGKQSIWSFARKQSTWKSFTPFHHYLVFFSNKCLIQIIADKWMEFHLYFPSISRFLLKSFWVWKFVNLYPSYLRTYGLIIQSSLFLFSIMICMCYASGLSLFQKTLHEKGPPIKQTKPNNSIIFIFDLLLFPVPCMSIKQSLKEKGCWNIGALNSISYVQSNQN